MLVGVSLLWKQKKSHYQFIHAIKYNNLLLEYPNGQLFIDFSTCMLQW